MGEGVIHSFICFALCFWGVPDIPTSSGQPGDMWLASTCYYSAVVFVVTGKVMLLTETWTKYNYAFVFLSIMCWFFTIHVYSNYMFMFSPSLWGMSGVMFGMPSYWIIQVLSVSACIVPDVAIEYYQ